MEGGGWDDCLGLTVIVVVDCRVSSGLARPRGNGKAARVRSMKCFIVKRQVKNLVIC